MLSGFDILINVIEIAIIVWLVCNYLTLKPGVKFWHITALYAVLFTELMISNMLLTYDISLFVVASITIFIFTLFATSNHIIEKVFVSATVMNLISILNMFTLTVVSTMFKRTILEVAQSSGSDKIAAIIVSKILFLSASLIIVNFRKSIKTFMSFRWWQFAILSGLGMVSVTILINFLFTHEINYSLLVAVIFLIIALMVFIYFLFIRIQIEQRQRYDDMILIKELSFQKKSIDDILAINEEMKKYRHDVKHVLSAAIGLASNDHSDEAVALLTKYREDIDALHEYVLTGNAGLDYVLNSKISFGSKRGIRFKTLFAATKLSMHIDDLCVLVGNALDNAIEHCDGVEKEIHIEFRDVNEYVSIKVTNTITQSVLNNNPNLQTTKNDAQYHGYGVKSMRYIAQKYHGEIDFKEEQDKFVCQIILRS